MCGGKAVNEQSCAPCGVRKFQGVEGKLEVESSRVVMTYIKINTFAADIAPARDVAPTLKFQSRANALCEVMSQ